MQDCEVTISVHDGKIEMEGSEGLLVQDFAALAGYMQIVAGVEACHNGMPLEDIKTVMLDIHQDAMRDVERNIKTNGRNQ